MNKILLALTFLAAGAGAFHSASQHVTQLQQKVRAANESWQIHTQQFAAARSEQAALTERVRELRQTPTQSQPVSKTELWSALQTNRADHLPAELRQRVLAELGFEWRTSPDYIIVSKQAVRELQMAAVRDGQLSEAAAAVLALTPEERGQVEAAIQRVKTDFKDWVSAHMERSEPKDDVVAHYTLPEDPATSQSISNGFGSALSAALGRERAEVILASARDWMVNSIGLYDCARQPQVVTVKRNGVGTEQRLKFQIENDNGRGVTVSYDLPSEPQWNFPRAFRPLFPNGWADVAQREGFELPEKPQEK
ncbi:MAG: hypothetical protein HY298_08860 [Verrucomicrobia bacterium]|nr:hypothetical protein [Verrucomicrobiota bacterium]